MIASSLFADELAQLARVSPHPNIVRLIGVVAPLCDNEDTACAFLLECIPCSPLGVVVSATAEEKARWRYQVNVAIDQLRHHNLVRGNAEPASIVILGDPPCDVVLVDIGGGYTRAFIVKDRAGTRDGDRRDKLPIFSSHRRHFVDVSAAVKIFRRAGDGARSPSHSLQRGSCCGREAERSAGVLVSGHTRK